MAFILGAFAAAGTMEFNDRLAAAEERIAKPTAHGEARIWSRKCERQGKRVFATQADGGRWRITCVKAEVKL